MIELWRRLSAVSWVSAARVDTSVIELRKRSRFNSRSGSGEGLTLVERFTRVDADTLEYEVKVNDPQMYTRPWTVAYPFERASHLLYEYACHEGNYGLYNTLTGARAEEASAAVSR